MRNKSNNKTVTVIKTLVAVVILAIAFSAGVLLGTNGYGYGISYVGTQAEAEYNEGGYQATGENSSTSQEVVLKNPTFKELRDFILRDPTNRNEFVLNQYECRHFATEVNNNAEANDLRCAFVLLCYDRGQHAVVAFNTTDRGLVYIEPQTDAAIHPEVGGSYQGKEIKEILIAW